MRWNFIKKSCKNISNSNLNKNSKKAYMRVVSAVLMLCIGMLALYGCTAYETAVEEPVPEVTGEFKVTALDIGKADAIILETENHCTVIDCGEKGDGKKVLSYLSESGITYVDYLFITHFDKDHVGGAAKVIGGVEIGSIIVPNYTTDTDEYISFLEAAETADLEPLVLTENMTFALDDVLFEVYPPKRTVYEESDNDFSLVISVTHGENTFLFAGDAETDRLAELPGQLELEHIFLKVPHHGNYDSGSKSFLSQVSPTYAVITCSEKNPADDRIIDLLESMGCTVYLTRDGDITAVSDGSDIAVSQTAAE